MSEFEMKNVKRKGFTLIEMLVVIAIITIIAAILFPVFASAREKARQTTCASNMKQIGVAVTMYAQDYDEMIVPSAIGTAGVNLVAWPSLLMPYLKSAGVFVCPDADDSIKPYDSKYISYTATAQKNPPDALYQGLHAGTTGSSDGADGSDSWLCQVPLLTYSRNLIATTKSNPWDAIIAGRVCNNGKTYPNFVDYTSNFKSGWVGSGTTTSITLAQVACPESTIHIVDGMAGGPAGTSAATFLTYGGRFRGIQQDIRTDLFMDAADSKVCPRHNGGFVILFGDGHAGWRVYGSSTPCDWTIQDDACN